MLRSLAKSAARWLRTYFLAVVGDASAICTLPCVVLDACVFAAWLSLWPAEACVLALWPAEAWVLEAGLSAAWAACVLLELGEVAALSIGAASAGALG